MKLKAIKLPQNKTGWLKDELIYIGNGEFALADCANPSGIHWQAHYLYLINEKSEIKEGEPFYHSICKRIFIATKADIQRISELKDPKNTGYWQTKKHVYAYLLVATNAPCYIGTLGIKQSDLEWWVKRGYPNMIFIEEIESDTIKIQDNCVVFKKLPDLIQGLVAKMEEKKVKVLFGLEQQGHIPTIEAILKKYGGGGGYKHVWEEIGKKIGWCPLTACSSYLDYVLKNKPEAIQEEKKESMIIDVDDICPVTKQPCDYECRPLGACNLIKNEELGYMTGEPAPIESINHKAPLEPLIELFASGTISPTTTYYDCYNHGYNLGYKTAKNKQ